MRWILVLVFISLLACNDRVKKENTIVLETTPESSFESLQSLNWILGSWSNISEGSQSYERWEVENDSLFIGMSITMKDGDTIFAERMRLFQNKGIVGLFVETVGAEPNPVVFTQVPNAEHLFTFENIENEFPSQIIYTQPEADKIHAWVSGNVDGSPQKMDFYFNRTLE